MPQTKLNLSSRYLIVKHIEDTMNLDEDIKFTKVRNRKRTWVANYYFCWSKMKEPLIYENRLATVRALKSIGVRRKNISIIKTTLPTNPKCKAYEIKIVFENDADEALFVMRMLEPRTNEYT